MVLPESLLKEGRRHATSLSSLLATGIWMPWLEHKQPSKDSSRGAKKEPVSCKLGSTTRLGAYLWASSCPPVQTPVVVFLGGGSLIFVYRQLNVILIETHTHLYM